MEAYSWVQAYYGWLDSAQRRLGARFITGRCTISSGGLGFGTLLDRAIAKTGADHVAVRHRPRLLSDNGPCFASKELAEYLQEHEITHTRSRPYHPMTQGKIERYHRSMKNVLTLEHYYLPDELERAIAHFIQYYNHERVHEALENLTPADVYSGRHREILPARERLKRQTLRRRRRQNLGRTIRKEALIRPGVIREVSLNLEPQMSKCC